MIVGYTALHYGKDYLGCAIRSVINHVDEYHVLYTPIGSHGSRTATACPETRAELYAIARQAAGAKLRWHDGEWLTEGNQRDSIGLYAPDADVILVLDADEIWPDELASRIIGAYSRQAGWLGVIRNLKVPMIHFWRSFYYAVIDDKSYPARVIFPKNELGDATWEEKDTPIAHMGYAQRSEIVEYKQLTHGHRGEWRQDINWYRDRFLANAHEDCHPVVRDYWNPVLINPLDYMPSWMSEHPYFSQRVIA